MMIRTLLSAPTSLLLTAVMALGAAAPKGEKPNPPEKYDITGHIAVISADYRAKLTLSGRNKPTRTITAQADGSYAFRSIPPGSYTLRPTHPKFTFSPSFHTVALTNHDLQAVDFTAHQKGARNR